MEDSVSCVLPGRNVRRVVSVCTVRDPEVSEDDIVTRYLPLIRYPLPNGVRGHTLAAVTIVVWWAAAVSNEI